MITKLLLSKKKLFRNCKSVLFYNAKTNVISLNQPRGIGYWHTPGLIKFMTFLLCFLTMISDMEALIPRWCLLDCFAFGFTIKFLICIARKNWQNATSVIRNATSVIRLKLPILQQKKNIIDIFVRNYTKKFFRRKASLPCH